MNYHQLSVEEIQKIFATNEKGLATNQAARILEANGKNELIQKKKKSVWYLLLHQFTEVMVLILLLAAVVSVMVGDIKDAMVILVIVLLNAIIGFVQEFRAEKAIDSLKKMSALKATVKRNGTILEIDAAELVVGDVVLLEAGNIVPADIRITEAHSLKIEESSLTGESLPVEKNYQILQQEKAPIGDRKNMGFKSTTVVHGRGEGIVVAVGMNTEIGKIAQLLQVDESKTPLQKRLADFSKRLSFVVLGICILLFVTGILRGEPPVNMLLTAISVAVAAIPEALPAIITIALAVGAKRLVKQNALIRKLPSVETLGSVTYICSDKTGTITQNKMTVTDTWIADTPSQISAYSHRELLLMAVSLNHDVQVLGPNTFKGDPTEIALVEYALVQKIMDQPSQAFPRKAELPFDSIRKRMTTIHLFEGTYLIITKGAVESILTCCKEDDAESIQQQVNHLAEQGKRVLGYAYTLLPELPQQLMDVEQNLQFLGLVGMIDPPRAEATEAIALCHTAGIIPVMITGDHPQTARAIASATGILNNKNDQVITGKELEEMSSLEFEASVEQIKVYARVSPEQKLNIVEALQKKKHFVAMTGDGVNDAPALRKANIGIAMGISGTDVSKEAAQMILLDDNFATIIKAIKEGRRIFDNTKKFIKYTLTSNGGEIWTIFWAPLIGLPIPLLPIHILWINLVTDGLPGLAFAAEPAEENILARKPRATNESVFARGLGIHILWVGLLMGLVCIGTQAWAQHLGKAHWQTMVFTVLCISQMGHALAIRSHYKSLFQMGIFSNPQLIFAILLTFVLQMVVVYVPFLQDIFKTQALSLNELIICIALSSVVFWAVEMEKFLKRRTMKQKA